MRFLAFLLYALLAWPQGAKAEEFMCNEAAGCEAVTKGPNGDPVVVVFRHGDIVDSDRGWLVAEGWIILDAEPDFFPAAPPPPPIGFLMPRCFECGVIDVGDMTMHTCSYIPGNGANYCKMSLTNCAPVGSCSMGVAPGSQLFASISSQLVVKLPGPEMIEATPIPGFPVAERRWYGNTVVYQLHPDPAHNAKALIGDLQLPTGLSLNFDTGEMVVLVTEAEEDGSWRTFQTKFDNVGTLPKTGGGNTTDKH